MLVTDSCVEPPIWRDYWTLCKPRVVALMLLTALIGMYLSTSEFIPLSRVLYAMLGIALSAASAAAINHLVDKHIDALMARTSKRPVAQGRLSVKQAAIFASLLGVAGLSILIIFVNMLTAVLTFATLIGYAGIYTLYLKRATPQNIVIGGLAGAAPPLLGWTAVSNQLDPYALLLVLIIFTWTPPHFWALAIYRLDDYRQAEIPMMPVTHGIQFTKLNIVLYTILLFVVSLLPVITGMSHLIYGIGAFGLGLRFLQWAFRLYYAQKPVVAMQTFRFSIVYLMALFVFLLVDHYMG